MAAKVPHSCAKKVISEPSFQMTQYRFERTKIHIVSTETEYDSKFKEIQSIMCSTWDVDPRVCFVFRLSVSEYFRGMFCQSRTSQAYFKLVTSHKKRDKHGINPSGLESQGCERELWGGNALLVSKWKGESMGMMRRRRRITVIVTVMVMVMRRRRRMVMMMMMMMMIMMMMIRSGCSLTTDISGNDAFQGPS